MEGKKEKEREKKGEGEGKRKAGFLLVFNQLYSRSDINHDILISQSSKSFMAF